MALGRYTIQAGDTIHHVARRTMGHADQWWVLVRFNSLDYPYIDTSVDVATTYPGKTVFGTGATLLLPDGFRSSDTRNAFAEASVEQYRLLLGVDFSLDDAGDLEANVRTEDWATMAGIKNLLQALTHRLLTRKGELAYHPSYGSHLERHIGQPLDEARAGLIRQEVRETLLDDPRIVGITWLRIDHLSDHLDIQLEAQVIGANTTVPLNLILQTQAV